MPGRRKYDYQYKNGQDYFYTIKNLRKDLNTNKFTIFYQNAVLLINMREYDFRDENDLILLTIITKNQRKLYRYI